MVGSMFRSNCWMLLGYLLLLGCGVDKGEEEAKNFVGSYCSVLQEAYARADLKVIGQMATEKELKKLFPVIQALSVTDNSMRTEILEFKVKKAKVRDDKAEVVTSERWRYWWIDRKSGTVTKQKNEESYRLQYNLVRVNGQWQVDSIKNLDQ